MLGIVGKRQMRESALCDLSEEIAKRDCLIDINWYREVHHFENALISDSVKNNLTLGLRPLNFPGRE
jgi:hypothetical protein